MQPEFERIAERCDDCRRVVEETGGVEALCLGHDYLRKVTSPRQLTAEDERTLRELLDRRRR